MDNTTKQQEIKALTDLCNNDTYFAQFFAKDLDTMIQNIQNDYPIEMGTCFYQKVEKIEELSKEKIKSLCETMLCVQAYGNVNDKSLEERVIKEYGQTETIQFKHSLGIQLSREEIDYLISKI